MSDTKWDYERVKRIYQINDLEIPTLGDNDNTGTDWLFRDRIPDGKGTMLSGIGGVGKSTLALLWILSVLTGRELLEGFIPPRRDPKGRRFPKCVLLSAEDTPAEVEERAWRIAEAFDIPNDEMRHAMRRLAMVTQRGPLVERHEGGFHQTTLLANLGALVEHETRIGPGEGKEIWRVRFVVIDPVRNRLGAIDENSNTQVGGFIDTLLEWMPDIAILLIGHARKDGGGSRGAGAWIDACRSAFELESDNNGLVLRHTKSNYSAKIPDMRLAFKDGVIMDAAINDGEIAEAICEWLATNPEMNVSLGGLRQNRGKGVEVLTTAMIEQFPGCGRPDVLRAATAAIKAGTIHEAEITQANGKQTKILRLSTIENAEI